MAGRKAGQKVFDWAKLSSYFSEQTRGEFLAFKGRYEAQKAKMNAFSEKPEPVDWSFYKRSVSNTELVETFQNQYAALTIPYPEDIMSKSISCHQKEIDVKSRKLIEEAKLQNLELCDELAKLKAEKPYEDMTIDEYLSDKPELREKAERDMLNFNWYIPKKY